jgi:phage repressor protein C with HTH and peptisase S24 domain
MSTIAERIIQARIDAGYNKAAPAARAIGVNYQTYIGHEDGSRIPKAEFLEKYAKAFGVTTSWLLNGISQPHQEQSPIPVQQIRVEGTSYAGLFKDISLIEDNEHEREYVPGTVDPRYPHAHHYALNVAGDSMNNLFRDGSKVVCAAWGDLGIEVKQGHILHIERRRFASEIETTLKVYSEQDGKRWLNPNSTNEKHKPIEINGNEDTEITIKGLVLYELNKMSY